MKKLIKKLIYIALSIFVFGIALFFIWAAFDYKADKVALTNALNNDSLIIVNTNNYISIKPLNFKSTKAYIFYPGAKVQPEAYILKLSSIALSNNIQIFVPKMFKNLAFFGIDKAAMIQNSFPGIKHWYIGGHSLGGSMACLYAKKNAKRIDGVLLFSTYSGTDISKCSFKVLSINGTEDGVFSPKKIEDHRNELPKEAQIRFLTGMNHSGVGNYGYQSGDKPSKLNDKNTTLMLIDSSKDFFE